MLKIPWTARRLDQSVLKEINPDYPLEGLMLKLKPHYFGHLMRQVDSLEKTLTLGKIEGRRRRRWQRMRWLDGITDAMDMNLGRLQEIVKNQGSLVCCSPQYCKELNVTEQLNNKFCWKDPHSYLSPQVRWGYWANLIGKPHEIHFISSLFSHSLLGSWLLGLGGPSL